MNAEEIRNRIKRDATEHFWSKDPVTGPQLRAVRTMIAHTLGRDESADVARHQLLEYLFGKPHSGDLTKGEASALIDWLSQDDGARQVYLLLMAWGYEHGQMPLMVGEDEQNSH